MYHVTIMPCYDKKLEASREDFYNDIYRTRDVDCVISTGKLMKRNASNYCHIYKKYFFSVSDAGILGKRKSKYSYQELSLRPSDY